MLTVAALGRLLDKCPAEAWLTWEASHRLMVWIHDPGPLCWGWIDLDNGIITQYETPQAKGEASCP